MAAVVNVTVNTNGLGTAQVYYGSGEQYENYAEVHFMPNVGVTIDWKYHYEYTVTYTPESGRDPYTYSGEGSYNTHGSMVEDGCPLVIACDAGAASYFATVTWTIDIRGSSDIIPHSVDPDGSGRFDYFFRFRPDDGWKPQLYWKVSPILPDYELRYTRFFKSDGTHYTETRLSSGVFVDVGFTSCIAYFWIPGATVTLDPRGGVVSPTSIQVRENKPYGYLQSLPTPTRTGFRFLGWYTSWTGGTLVTDETINTSRRDHTLYAQWEALQVSYTVKAMLTDGTRLKVDGTEAKYISYGYEGTPDTRDPYIHIFTTHADESVMVAFYGLAYKINGYKLDHILVNGVRVDEDSWYDQIYEDMSFVGVYKPKRQFTYLPMYLPANGKILRGNRWLYVIRDGDEE